MSLPTDPPPHTGDAATSSLPPTEQHRADLLDLDLRPTAEQVALMLGDHRDAVEAVLAAAPQIAEAVAAIGDRLAEGGGRLVYVGAGTAGRLGLLDASEVPPTFGSDRVVAVLAGGEAAFASALEGAEDDPEAARRDLGSMSLGWEDVVVGVAASGRTPYTMAAVRTARAAGALTVGVSSNTSAPLSDEVDHAIEVDTGPELIAGSTRLKAGTAQKITLNTLSTLVMVRLGRTFGNLMVELRSSNAKLRERARQIVIDATGAPAPMVDDALDAADGDRKVAIVVLLAQVDAGLAREHLEAAAGRVRAALSTLADQHVEG